MKIRTCAGYEETEVRPTPRWVRYARGRCSLGDCVRGSAALARDPSGSGASFQPDSLERRSTAGQHDGNPCMGGQVGADLGQETAEFTVLRGVAGTRFTMPGGLRRDSGGGASLMREVVTQDADLAEQP